MSKIDEHQREVKEKLEEVKKDLYRLMIELELSEIRSDSADPIEETMWSIKKICNRILASF
jgi:uncharacterized protein with PhoU and TrkA domain